MRQAFLSRSFQYGETDQEQYVTEGYANFPRFLDEAGLALCRLEIDRMVQQKHPQVPVDQIISAHHQKRWMWDLATDEPLLDMIEQQIGPNIVLWSSHLLCKPPHSGNHVPWHQDAPYWNVSGRLAGAVWIAFDDIDADNGGMCVLPRWHDKGTLPRRKTSDDLFTDEIDPGALPPDVEERKVQYCFPAGGMATHHTMIPHTSEPNRSDRWRRVLVLRYMAADGQMGPKTYRDYRTGESFERRFFLVRGQDVANKKLAHDPF